MRLGKYEILQRIAAGGMAELYLAHARGARGFQRKVVIKQIKPELTQTEEFVQMFLDEARIAASLHHSNIVQVYDFGSAAGAYYLVMEFLHGADSRKLLRRLGERSAEPLSLAAGLSIMSGVCAGLHHAHEKIGSDGVPMGIVHRDVSPENIFITFEGGVKLLDFGIARATQRITKTQSGSMKGKFGYMSPEQCLQRPLDRRSDIFSLGVVLWELVTGTRLFKEQSDFEIMKRIVEDVPPPPSRVRRDVPPDLDGIVLRALEKDPDARFQTAQELQVCLEALAREQKLSLSALELSRVMHRVFDVSEGPAELLASHERQTRTVRRRRRAGLGLLMAGALGASLVSAGLVVVRAQHGRPVALRTQVVAMNPEPAPRATAPTAPAQLPALAPEPVRAAPVSSHTTGTASELRRLHSSTPKRRRVAKAHAATEPHAPGIPADPDSPLPP